MLPGRPDASRRIPALDLIRGVAVLGILAVNISGFAGPMSAAYSPHVLGPVSPADEAVYATMLLLFEGKMRALFSMLFGASLLLFVERAEESGRNGQMLQLRRLSWLLLFGYLHFALLWWGDILFLYALAGFAALALRGLPSRAMLTVALLIFAAWQINGTARNLPDAALALEVSSGGASSATLDRIARNDAKQREAVANEMAEYRKGFAGQVSAKLSDRPFFPLEGAFYSVGETLPYMLIGMVLLRSGFFSGGWNNRQLRAVAVFGIGIGGAATAAFTLWAWSRHFPFAIMLLAINHGLSVPHLLMALGCGAAIMLAAPRLLASRIGVRIAAAGRMAFSNYIGTSLLMTTLFYGWGLGLVGTVRPALLPLFVLLGWVVMLGWSKPWLSRFRQGPLEWLWRALNEGNMKSHKQ